MADTVHQGDKVSWHWGSSNPSGTVSEVKPGEVSVTSHKGNVISKMGDNEDPAVHISRSGNDVVKKVSELSVDKASGSGDASKAEEEKKGEADQNKTDDKKGEIEKENGYSGQNGTKKELDEEEPQTGEKRKLDDLDQAVANVVNGSNGKTEEKVEEKADEKAEEKADGRAEEKAEKKVEDEVEGDAEADNGESKPKKQKTEANGTATKRGPGRPKGAAKKDKKEKAPVAGRAERKTRSQGSA